MADLWFLPPAPGAFGAFPSVLCPQHRSVGAALLRAQLVAAALGAGAGGAAALGAGAAAVRATEVGAFSKGICRIPKKPWVSTCFNSVKILR